MKIVFAGTPAIAVPTLEAVAQVENFEISAVLTTPDKRAGRGNKLICCPVKEAADRLGLKTICADKITESVRDEVAALGADILVVVAFGTIFKEDFLSLFPLGGVNMHPSLLPEFRGPSPLSATILSGSSTWAISVQELALKMDAGDIYAQESFPFGGDETTGSLTDLAAVKGAEMVAVVLKDIMAGKAVKTPQDHGKATFCKLLKKENGRIDWSQDAAYIERMIRAFSPWPGSFTFYGGKKLTFHEARCYSKDSGDSNISFEGKNSPGSVLGLDKQCGLLVNTGDGVLAVRRLQLQSKKAMDYKAFYNGNKAIVGAVLGE